MTGDGLSIFVVYYERLDFPDGYTVRRHVVGSGGRIEPDPEPLVHSTSLRAAHAAIHRFAGPLVMLVLTRNPDDEPHIVEVWL